MGNPLVVQPGAPWLSRGQIRAPGWRSHEHLSLGMEEKAGCVGPGMISWIFLSLPQPYTSLKAK